MQHSVHFLFSCERRTSAVLAALAGLLFSGCSSSDLQLPAADAVQPRIVTEATQHDTDDAAIWIHPTNPAQSLVLGTDKDTDGSLYAFNLDGETVQRVRGLKRPNNVDVGYGLELGGQRVDLAVVTEREEQRLRFFRLPELQPLDAGDLVVFNGDTERAPMGVALYRRPEDGAFFAIVSGKSGPREGYLAQYRVEDDGRGNIELTLAREFGRYAGRNEIEAIAVDAELGYVYYSDEGFGVRKYAANPDAPNANEELASFGTQGFAEDHEGISIYKLDARTGYILVSDQQANRFQVFRREGEPGRPHEHVSIISIPVTAIESDGSEVTSAGLGANFPHGLFVAMSNGRVFHYYAWEDLAGDELKQAAGAPATR